MAVPSGMNAQTFADGLAEMRSAVGDGWVFTAPEDLNTYRDFYSVLWDEPEERVASAAVAPAVAGGRRRRRVGAASFVPYPTSTLPLPSAAAAPSSS